MADVTFTDNSKEVLAALDAAKRQALDAIGLTAEGHAKAIPPLPPGGSGIPFPTRYRAMRRVSEPTWSTVHTWNTASGDGVDTIC